MYLMRHSTVQDENLKTLLKLKQTPKSIKIGNEVYGEIPQVAVVAAKWLVEVWDKLGRPESPLSESGEKLMKVIIAAWEDLYPKDAEDWYAARKEYQDNELSIPQQVHRHTGRSLASFPLPIFQMMKKVFPKYKINDRENVIKLVGKFPAFRMANKV